MIFSSKLAFFICTLKNSSHILHLFLDSLDECRIRIPQVATILVNHISQISNQLGRLRIRIACRTADWPATLEMSLPNLWGDDSFGAYELCPLLKKDIEVAAQIEGADASKFMAELNRTETVPLAIKPVTLACSVESHQFILEFPLFQKAQNKLRFQS